MKREYAHNEVLERITKKRIYDYDTYQSIENTAKNDNQNHEKRQQIISDQNEWQEFRNIKEHNIKCAEEWLYKFKRKRDRQKKMLQLRKK